MLRLANHSISSLQDMLNQIYGELNNASGFDYLFGYLAKNLFRPRNRGNDSNNIFIKSLSYLMAIASSFKIDLQEAFLQKFPDICPYCYSAPCKCNISGKKATFQLATYDNKDELVRAYEAFKSGHDMKDITLEYAFKIIINIYPNNAHDWVNHGNSYHLVKMGEEIGELHEVCCHHIRQNSSKDSADHKNVMEEIADVFVWCLSEWGLINSGRSMTKEFLQCYADGCSGCKHEKCTCNIRQERNRLLIGSELGYRLLKLGNHIMENHIELPVESKKSLSESLTNLENKIENDTERNIYGAAARVEREMRSIASYMSDEESKNLSVIRTYGYGWFDNPIYLV